MPSPTPTINPITDAQDWHTFLLAGVQSPGVIPPGGTEGFERPTGWDKKAGKGAQGATLTLTTQPPAEGTFTLQLATAQDFTDWDTFVENVLSIAPAQQKASGLPIFYPEFSSIGLTTVVVEHYTGPKHVGKGMYHVKIKLIEWQPPPSTSVVSTVAHTEPDQSDDSQVTPPDPEIDALEAQLALLNQGNQNP